MGSVNRNDDLYIMGSEKRNELYAALKERRDHHRLLNPLTECPQCGKAIDEIIMEEKTSITPILNCGVRISHNCRADIKCCDLVHLCTKCYKFRKGQLPRSCLQCTNEEQEIPASGAHTHEIAAPNDDDVNSMPENDPSFIDDLPSDSGGLYYGGDADDDDGIKQPNVSAHIESSELNEKCKKFLSREFRRKDDGMIGLVVDALVDDRVDGDRKFMGKDQANKHLFQVAVYHKASKDLGEDITAMTDTLAEEHNNVMNNLQGCIKEAVVEQLKKSGDDGLNIDTDALSNTIAGITMEKLTKKQNSEGLPPINLTDHAAVNRYYLIGKKSILQNLPIPDVKELNGFAYVPLEQIVNR